MTAARWIVTLVGGLLVGILIISATASLDHVFDGSWLVSVAMPTVDGLIVAMLMRGLGGRLWVPLLAGSAAGVLTTARTWWGHTLAGGFIPTRDTLSAMLLDLEKTRTTIQIEQSPIEPHPHVVAVLSLVVLFVALVVELIALGLRSPALAGLPALAVIGVAAFVSGEVTPLPALLLAATAWLGLLVVGDHPALSTRIPWTIPVGKHFSRSGSAHPHEPRPAQSERLSQLTGSAVAAACALAVLAVSATQMGPITTGLAPEGQRFLIHNAGPVDPASDLGEALRQGSGPVGIEYRSSTGLGVYLRTAVIHDVTASQWVPRETGGGVQPNGNLFDPAGKQLRDLGPSSGLPFVEELGDALTRPTQESIQLDLSQYRGTRLPVADQPVGQDGLASEQGWVSHPRTATVARGDTSPVDLQYESRYWTLPLSSEEMTAIYEGSGLHDPEAYFGLEVPNQSAVGTLVSDPDLQGTQIQAQAREIIDGAGSPFEVGQLLQEHFQSGEYDYSETAPVDQGYDGTGIEITEQFLEAQSGYCIHYASAMAMMARSVDVPARIVVGYAPIGPDADGVHRVEARMAHAWPELYIFGLGWVPFEPTPTVGRAPAYAQIDSGPAPEEAPTAPPTPSETAEPTPSESSPPETAPVPGASERPGVNMQAVLTGLGIALAVFAVVLLALAPHLIRARRRRRRLSASPSPSAGVRTGILAAWREVEDTASDLGMPREEHESEETFAKRLIADLEVAASPGDSVIPASIQQLAALARAAQWARYAADDSAPPCGAAEAPRQAAVVVKSLESDAEPAVRRRAWWLPTSMVTARLHHR